MAEWKKVIVSGSQAELAGITGSLLTDGTLLGARDGGAVYSTGVTIDGQGHLDGVFSGSFEGDGSDLTGLTLDNSLTDGNGIVDFTFDGSAAATVVVEADGSTLSVGADGVKVAAAGITATELNTSVAGDGLAGGAGTALSVNVDDATLEIDSDIVRIKDSGVTFAKVQNLSTMTVIGRTAAGSGVSSEVSILDEDTLSSDSATALATQQSIKAYVDAQVGGATLNVSGSGDTSGPLDLNDNDLFFAGESGVISTSASISSGDITITTAVVDGGIANAKLANSAMTIAGTSVSLGGTIAGDDIISDVSAGQITNSQLANDSVHISGSGINATSVDLGATASINLNVDNSTVEIAGDSLQVKDLGIDTDHLAAGAVETAKIADGNVTNAKLANDGLMIGATDITLGTTASTFDGLTLTGVEATGSFTGSFVGDGSGLTGLATNLTVDGDTGTESTDLIADDLQFLGTANEIETAVTKVGNDVRVTIGLPQDVTIAGDLTVLGTRTELNVEDLVVQDQFIYLASGSAGATDGGIIVEGAADNDGAGFGWDQSEGRWGFDNAMLSGSNSITPTAYASAVVTSDSAAYQKVGNIRVDTGNEEIFIYV